MENTQTQKIIVVALIRDDDGKILFQKRVDPLIPTADGKWELSGGKVDFGEMPEAAVIRECLEEVGCTVEIIRFLPTVQSRIWERTGGVSVQVFVLCFEARIISGTPRPLDKKISEVGWFTPQEALTLDLLAGVADFIALCRP